MAEFLQLAHKLTDKNRIGGWYMSEKLDGTRCFWDGGLSRDRPTDEVPFANLSKKVKPVATGLWSRYGNPIMAPDWWLNQLPPMPLDGELFAGRGNYQKCRSIVSKDRPDPKEWESIEYAVFDSPSLDEVFSSRTINSPNFRKTLICEHIDRWIRSLPECRLADFKSMPGKINFEEVITLLNTDLDAQGRVYLHSQRKLPNGDEQAREAVEQELLAVIESGGEGVVLRDPRAQWLPRRTKSLLKVTPLLSAEGVLTAFTEGQGRLQGMIGALVLDYNGKRLEVAGLTDAERNFSTTPFTLGDEITFRYRELTDAGIPKSARYWRVREIE